MACHVLGCENSVFLSDIAHDVRTKEKFRLERRLPASISAKVWSGGPQWSGGIPASTNAIARRAYLWSTLSANLVWYRIMWNPKKTWLFRIIFQKCHAFFGIARSKLQRSPKIIFRKNLSLIQFSGERTSSITPKKEEKNSAKTPLSSASPFPSGKPRAKLSQIP